MDSQVTAWRTEQKYVLTLAQASQLRAQLRQVLHPDQLAISQRYPVRSLYFDTLDQRDYYQKLAGVECRHKIRLRLYALDDPTCKLEIKRKFADQQRKTSLTLTKAEAEALSAGRYSVLCSHFATQPEAIHLYAEMITHHYRPVVLTEYEREALTWPWGNTRLTFDERLRSSESQLQLYARRPLYTALLREQVIFEVKTSQSVPGFISQLLAPYHLTPLAASKYCLSRPTFYEFD